MNRLPPEILNNLTTKLYNLKFLIMDEISMVGRRVFHQINTRLQEIFHSKELFGGISIITFGDFNQLKPVMDEWIFDVNNKDPLSILSGPYLWRLFSIYELNEIMRQKDDHLFATALKSLANDTLTDEMNQLLKSREIQTLISNHCYPPQEAVHLFYTNKRKDEFNNICLNNSNNERYIIKAIDVCLGNAPEKNKTDVLSKIKKLPSQKTQGLPYEITAKINARYMITINIDVEDGITNGACGRLRHITWGQNKVGEKLILRVYIEFEDLNVGKMARNKMQNQMKKNNINFRWTPIDYVTRTISTRSNSVYKVLRKQIPITPAEGITIHKSQGSTYENIVVHMENKCMDTRLLYVAFNRVTSVNGLFIEGIYTPPNIKSHDKAKNEINRLKRENPLQFNLKFPQDFKTVQNIIVMFHNVRSLNKHLLDISADRAFINADILLFVETWATKNDPLFLDGFVLISTQDCINNQQHFGNAVFIKISILENNYVHKFYDKHFQEKISVTGLFINDNALIFVYNKITASFNQLHLMITEARMAIENHQSYKNIIIVGDFNINLKDNESAKVKQLMDLMSELKFVHVTPDNHSSTIYNSQIDYCFSLSNIIQAFYYETTFSDHKAIWFQL